MSNRRSYGRNTDRYEDRTALSGVALRSWRDAESGTGSSALMRRQAPRTPAVDGSLPRCRPLPELARRIL
jgi:hypothetical protein